MDPGSNKAGFDTAAPGHGQRLPGPLPPAPFYLQPRMKSAPEGTFVPWPRLGRVLCRCTGPDTGSMGTAVTCIGRAGIPRPPRLTRNGTKVQLPPPLAAHKIDNNPAFKPGVPGFRNSHENGAQDPAKHARRLHAALRTDPVSRSGRKCYSVFEFPLPRMGLPMRWAVT